MAKKSNNVKQFERIMVTLSLLNNDERPKLKDLAKEFNVDKRTIYRDIEKFNQYGINMKTENGELYLQDSELFKRVTFTELEELVSHISMNMIDDVSFISKRKIDNLVNKLVKPEFKSSYLVKLDPYEEIDIESKDMETIEESIASKKVLVFIYKGNKVETSPFKIINIDEIWYLFGRDRESKKFKIYYIKEMKQLRLTYISVNEEENIIDKVIEGIQTPWYEDKEEFEVVVEVLEPIAHYFIRKKYLHSQNILEKRGDGSMRISFKVTHEEEVDNLVKSWLPNLKVISPVSLADSIKKDVQIYLSYLT